MIIDPAASGPGNTHLDPDRLADLAEGALDQAQAEASRAHLATCELCASDFALITLDSGIGALLPPEPIPAEVVARIEAALHREPPLAAADSAPVHHGPVRKPFRRRLMLAFGGLASVGLVVGGVTAGISALNHGETKGSTASSAGTSHADAQRQAAGGSTSSAASGSDNAPAAAAPTPDLKAQALALLRELGPNTQAAKTPAGAAPDAAGSSGSASFASRFGCAPVDKNGQAPLISKVIQYQGAPAEMLIYPVAGNARTVDVVVVYATCPASQASLAAQTLIEFPVDRS